jgi:hypothetical protein
MILGQRQYITSQSMNNSEQVKIFVACVCVRARARVWVCVYKLVSWENLTKWPNTTVDFYERVLMYSGV